MNEEPAPSSEDKSDEISSLIRQLQEVERKLYQLTGDEVDSVVLPAGRPLLLRRAQQKLIESEERFRSMFASAATGIAISTPQGRFLQLNEAYCRMLGYTEAELRERDFASITHPDDLALNLELRDAVLDGARDSFVLEKRYLKKNGDVVWTSHSVSAVRSSRGTVTAFIVVAEDISERKKAQDALRLFKTLLDQSNDAIEVMDAATRRFVDLNETAYASLGYSREEMLELSVMAIDPDSTPARTEEIDRELEKSGSATFESRHRRKDGSFFPVEVNLKLVKLDKAYIVSVARDITERKQAEAAVADSFKLHRLLFENMLEAYCFCQILYERDRPCDYIYLEVNDAFEPQTGLKNVVGRRVSEVVPGIHEANPEQLEIYSRVAATGKPERFETYTKLLGIWFSVSVYSYERGYFVAVFDNITERKRVETRFRRLLDSNAQAVFFWNIRAGITECNDGFLKLVGYDREDLKAGRIHWTALTPQEYLDLDARALKEIAAKGTSTPYEKEFIRKDGVRVPILIGAASFEDNRDEGICFMVDLTERKKFEAQLRQTQKMEAIGTLAGGIAHDFNNILHAIQGFTEIARMHAKDNAAVLDNLAGVTRSTTRAAALVQQILTFSRQNAHAREPVNLQPVLAETLKLLRATLPSSIEFDVAFDPQAPTVLADSNQIQQVMMNLGTNAWHAMKDRPGRLQVKLERFAVDAALAKAQGRLRPGVYARLSVSDNGCGMDPATVRRIFEPFFTTKPAGKGTGLGLSIVHGIMENHDGVVTVYSQPGEGTVFHLYFPAHAGPAAEPAAEEGPVPRGHGERILYVDDEEVLARLGSQTLTALGYRVESVTQPALAIENVKSDPSRFALVITDYTMPEMNGLQLAHELRRIRPDLILLLTTGYGQSLTPESIRAAGISHLLLKPASTHALGTAVHAALSGLPIARA